MTGAHTTYKVNYKQLLISKSQWYTLKLLPPPESYRKNFCLRHWYLTKHSFVYKLFASMPKDYLSVAYLVLWYESLSPMPCWGVFYFKIIPKSSLFKRVSYIHHKGLYIGFPIQIITPRHQRKETRDSLFIVFKQPQTTCKHNVVTELVAVWRL